MSQIFKKTDRPIYALVEWIKQHSIWLPELQRPYVRDRARVRDLFDSLYKWFPTWLVILLENETDQQTKAFWENNWLQKIPQYVVIDWQQRLTALYSVLTWFSVIKEDGTTEVIKISFNPIEEIFKVADAGTEKWQDWIYDIKDILQWDNLLAISNEYLVKYRDKYGVNSEVELQISQRIQRVFSIKNIHILCIEIFKSTPIETVSEIFLRINSRGKVLNNSDFILTLMSVYREEWRKLVEEFSNYTKKKNDIVCLWADEVIRILIWVWFKRAKLEDAYNFLKWQVWRFDSLVGVINQIIDHHQWANFLMILKDAWFIYSNLITQQSLVIACYTLYQIWMYEHKMNFQELHQIIKYYYVSMFIVQKYSTNAFETMLSKDFLKIQSISKEQFIQFFYDEIDSLLTADTWNITFPNNMDTSSVRSPLFIAYTASQIYWHKPLLFRNIPISKVFIDLKDKEILWEKIDIDLHHIFPKQYLIELYWADIKNTMINQIANKVYTYNSDNKTISSKSPKDYLALFSKNNEINWDINLENNAIPTNFIDMSYEDFLEERRKRMLNKIRQYVESIKNPWKLEQKDNLHDLIIWWENRHVEFKSSYRRDIAKDIRNDDLKFQITKTIAAFLNTEWGSLFVWLKDDGTILGIENDITLFVDKWIDGLLLNIDELIKNNFSLFQALVKVSPKVIWDKTILIFEVKQSSKPVYIMINGKKEFYIRRSASSIALTIDEAVNYIKDHFN